MKKFIYIISLLILGCSSGSPVQVKVEHKGALHEIMHQGMYEGLVLLDSMAKENTYGVGALDSLSGEVMIINGEVLISKVDNGKVVIDNKAGQLATLLVYSEVSIWDFYEVKAQSIDSLLIQKSQELGLSGAFPFQIKGSFPNLVYHVIDFDPKTGDLSRHKEGSWTGTMNSIPVEITGFYSREHEGVFTHMGSSLHMHVTNKEHTLMGHIDELELDNNAFTLLLPRQ